MHVRPCISRLYAGRVLARCRPDTTNVTARYTPRTLKFTGSTRARRILRLIGPGSPRFEIHRLGVTSADASTASSSGSLQRRMLYISRHVGASLRELLDPSSLAARNGGSRDCSYTAYPRGRAYSGCA